MPDRAGGVPWTDWQWSRVREVITQEATRTRVAGSVLPHYGPLPLGTELVPSERIDETTERLEEAKTIRLFDLSVRVTLTGQEVEQEELGGAMQLFRRAARRVARTEDWLIFRGAPPPEDARFCAVRGGEDAPWLQQHNDPHVPLPPEGEDHNRELIRVFVQAITELEEYGHFGPFVGVLGNRLFGRVYAASSALVLPRDRIEPLLGGGALLRSGVLPHDQGLVISLAGDPIDLAVAVDVEPQFLTIDDEARYIFRVHERFAPRIKEPRAIVQLTP